MANNESFLVIINSDRDQFAKTMNEEESTIMKEHFNYLKDLITQKKLILASLSLNNSGGYIILNVRDLEEAKQIMANGSFVKKNTLRPDFHPFRISLCRSKKEENR